MMSIYGAAVQASNSCCTHIAVQCVAGHGCSVAAALLYSSHDAVQHSHCRFKACPWSPPNLPNPSIRILSCRRELATLREYIHTSHENTHHACIHMYAHTYKWCVCLPEAQAKTTHPLNASAPRKSAHCSRLHPHRALPLSHTAAPRPGH